MAWKSEIAAAKMAAARAIPMAKRSPTRASNAWGKAAPMPFHCEVSWKYDPARKDVLVKHVPFRG